MAEYYLAIDLGASSGRHILGHMQDGKMILDEIHRFSNGMTQKGNELCWDLKQLFEEIKTGMKKCKELGKIPVSVGIDTWGVDFVLLDDKQQVIGNTVGYRDSRTNGMDEIVYKNVPEAELYARTGIQKQLFNTIYQLIAVKEKHPEDLEKAEHMLLVPDYFSYLLSGVMKEEYTIASTTQLVSPKTKDWDYDLIERLGLKRSMFKEMITPGSEFGHLSTAMQKEIGYDCKVIAPACHDTGSAVLAVPSNDPNTVYISSGTWSLMGVELKEADCSEQSKVHNFTNEGGYDYRFRYLKNIMGLWMIQSIKKEIGGTASFGEICDLASKEKIASLVPCNDNRFLAPASMTKEVQACCKESGQQVPQTLGEVAAVIYNSLAVCYGETVKEIEELTGKKYEKINVVGGGANAVYLNQLTANRTNRTVFAGPTESTAIGNVMVQMMAKGVFKDLSSARDCVFHSFDIKEYQPQ